MPSNFMDSHLGERIYLNTPVVSADRIEEFSEELFIIASLTGFEEIASFLDKHEIKDVYDAYELLNTEFNNGNLSEYAKEQHDYLYRYKEVINKFYSKNKLIITACELVVTERCTLKCRDCANLMQYYKKPEDIPYDSIVSAFDNFMDTIDLLIELRIIGGELFLYKDLKKILERYIEDEKIRNISLPTNGTIIPNEEILKIIKNDKVRVHISNYGINNYLIQDLVSELNKRNIHYYLHDYTYWFNFGDLIKRNYSNDQLTSIFSTCKTSHCHTLYRGKFYLCPRSAHCTRLKITEDDETENVDFREIGSALKKRCELKRLLSDTKCIKACAYCNGFNPLSEKIPAAVQVNTVTQLLSNN
jgi:hypothetical protein